MEIMQEGRSAVISNSHNFLLIAIVRYVASSLTSFPLWFVLLVVVTSN